MGDFSYGQATSDLNPGTGVSGTEGKISRSPMVRLQLSIQTEADYDFVENSRSLPSTLQTLYHSIPAKDRHRCLGYILAANGLFLVYRLKQRS